MRRAWTFLVILSGCSALTSPATHADTKPEPMVVRMSRTVANVEIENQEFATFTPQAMRSKPRTAGGDLRFGQIMRRLPSDPSWYAMHHVPLAATYRDGRPESLWCDLNLNARLDDESPLHLYDYPTPPGSRAALVDLAWTAVLGGDSIPVSWKTRIVLEPLAPPDTLPRYLLQRVYANTGVITADGVPRRAFLFDGNNDGLYTTEYGDGVFIDSDGDGTVTVDPTDPEFLPFSVPAQVGKTLFEVTQVARDGSEISLRAIPGQQEQRRADVGDMAPDFAFDSIDHRRVRLSDYRGHPVIVYFWESWCPACQKLAPPLRALYDRLHPRGLEILSISFDQERERLLAFEVAHREPWPVWFEGHAFWEHPVGRLYGVPVAGTAYLIDPDGRYRGRYEDLEDLEQAVAALLAPKGAER